MLLKLEGPTTETFLTGGIRQRHNVAGVSTNSTCTCKEVGNPYSRLSTKPASHSQFSCSEDRSVRVACGSCVQHLLVQRDDVHLLVQRDDVNDRVSQSTFRWRGARRMVGKPSWDTEVPFSSAPSCGPCGVPAGAGAFQCRLQCIWDVAFCLPLSV